VKAGSALKHTSRVTFELSNRCNYAYMHKACPAHGVVDPVILPEAIVRRVLAYLGAEGYRRGLAWHNYSEPLIDARLFMFLDVARELMPGVEQYILSNGFMLGQGLLDELGAHGVTHVRVTTYSEAEHERCHALIAPPGMICGLDRRKELDSRLDDYERKPRNRKQPCFEPLESCVIRATGHVALCCRDWANQHALGNLHAETLEEVLRKKETLAVWEQNRHGKRVLELCRRCGCDRGSDVPSYEKREAEGAKASASVA